MIYGSPGTGFAISCVGILNNFTKSLSIPGMSLCG
jgi:hypothetical protein